MIRGCSIVLLLACAVPCIAQRLRVLSPFTRVDPLGHVVQPDRGAAEPRHILSPGFPRNAWSSLRLVIEFDKQTQFNIDVGQNPENTVKVQMYREVYRRTPEGYYPDRLEPINIPYQSQPADFAIPGQRVVTFLMDFWVDRTAPVDRMKIEPQVWVSSIDDWVIYPMEVNILEPIVPDLKANWAATQPSVSEPSDAAIRPVLRAALCGTREKTTATQTDRTNTRDLLRRNARQHIALASQAKLAKTLVETTGYKTVKAWCAARPPKVAAGPEWYLRFRDKLFRQSEVSIKTYPVKPRRRARPAKK